MLILFVANPKPPEIDGKLDDEAWKSAPKFEGFTQHDPNEGEPATERTVFQILYDNESVYFGVECYDSEPDKITSRLMRRDSGGGADSVSINLDPRYDHQTGYWFTNDKWRVMGFYKIYSCHSSPITFWSYEHEG